jgi:hypothetical protein
MRSFPHLWAPTSFSDFVALSGKALSLHVTALAERTDDVYQLGTLRGLTVSSYR